MRRPSNHLTYVVLVALGLASCAGSTPPDVGSPVTAPSLDPTALASAAAPAKPAASSVRVPRAPMSTKALRRHVDALCAPAMLGRQAGSAEERLARTYIRDRLLESGTAAIDITELPFKTRSGRPSANLAVRIAAGGTVGAGSVVLGGHYDHLGQIRGTVYPGAEDNASGVAVLLEATQLLRAQAGRLRRDVWIVFFGAEESGMEGSRAYVKDPAVRHSVRAMVNIDMIGKPLVDIGALKPLKLLAGIDDRNSVGVIGLHQRPSFAAIVHPALKTHGLKAETIQDAPKPLQRFIRSIAEGRSDSFTFEYAGIPALFFSSGEADIYHQPDDTPDGLDYPLMSRRGHAIVDVVIALTQLQDYPEGRAKPESR